MSDLLNTTRDTIAIDKRSSRVRDRIGRRGRRARRAILLAGLATVIAAAVVVADDGANGPAGTSERPLIPFVTTDTPSVAPGYSSADG